MAACRAITTSEWARPEPAGAPADRPPWHNLAHGPSRLYHWAPTFCTTSIAKQSIGTSIVFPWQAPKSRASCDMSMPNPKQMASCGAIGTNTLGSCSASRGAAAPSAAGWPWPAPGTGWAAGRAQWRSAAGRGSAPRSGGRAARSRTGTARCARSPCAAAAPPPPPGSAPAALGRVRCFSTGVRGAAWGCGAQCARSLCAAATPPAPPDTMVRCCPCTRKPSRAAPASVNTCSGRQDMRACHGDVTSVPRHACTAASWQRPASENRWHFTSARAQQIPTYAK